MTPANFTETQVVERPLMTEVKPARPGSVTLLMKRPLYSSPRARQYLGAISSIATAAAVNASSAYTPSRRSSTSSAPSAESG